MKRKQQLMFIVFSLLAGFIGAFISNQFFSTKSAFAEKNQKPHKEIVAEAFKLVDRNGEVQGFLKTSYHPKTGKPYPYLAFSTEKTGFLLEVGDDSVNLSLSGMHSYIQIMAGENFASLSLGQGEKSYFHKNDIELITNSGETNISLNDKRGKLRTRIGNYNLVNKKTGVKQKHPLSSMVLVDDKENVLWSAP